VNVMDEGKRVLRVEAQSILDLADRIDENFSRAVEILYDPSFFTPQKGPMEILGC